LQAACFVVIVVRNVFQLKYGKTREAIALRRAIIIVIRVG